MKVLIQILIRSLSELEKRIRSRGRVGRLLCLLVLFAWIQMPVLAFAFADTDAEAEVAPMRAVRVASFEGTYNTINENGERSGYGYEYQLAVAGYTGWSYEYVTSDWSECLTMLQNGEVDMMGGVSYTEERAQTMLFSDLPMGEEKYYLYADLNDTKISATNLRSLNGKRIGVLENATPETMLSAWEEKHNLHTQHVNIVSMEDTLEKIENHEIDAFVSTEFPQWGQSNLSVVANIGNSGIYFVINRDRADLKEALDGAMRQLEYDRLFYKDELYKRYFSSVSKEVLTGKEQQWLKSHGAIRIGFLNHDVGVSVRAAGTGEIVGVINDYVKYASDCLGNQTLNFELFGFDSREEEIEALRDDRIDMIFHISQNPSLIEKDELALSDETWTYNLSVVTGKDYFDENRENIIAIPKDWPALKGHISYFYPKWRIVESDSLKDAVEMVRKGQADCFVAGTRLAAEYGSNRKFQSIPLTQPVKSAFAVRPGNRILLSILNKTLKSIPSSRLTNALAMHERLQEKVTVSDFIKDNLLTVIFLFGGIFLMILILILSYMKKMMELNRKLEASQQQLQEALKQAKEANKAKSNFLFNMSHDIRTPMNALLGYTKLMRKELTDPKLLDYQEKIEQSGNLLLSIINNVLDMARIESGKMEIDENYSEIGAVLREICGVFEEEAKKKEIRLSCEIEVTHEHVMCDETKIKEIFLNLVSNAVKYTLSGGSVTVRAKEIPCDQEGFMRIQTEVIDTGIGMSKEFLPSLFESFARERNTTTGKVAGTGLGMPIVKKLIDMMGGSIEVESRLGEGTRYVVTLQHRLADEVYYQHQQKTEKKEVSVFDQEEKIKGKHILLAEDNELNAEIAMTILNDMGLVVERVADGVECLDRMEQKPAGSYDLILMDVQMPNMDGYKATQAIRSLSDKKKANIPIIAMTANAFEEDRKRALANGMNGHIAKPIDVEKVEEIMISVLK